MEDVKAKSSANSAEIDDSSKKITKKDLLLDGLDGGMPMKYLIHLIECWHPHFCLG